MRVASWNPSTSDAKVVAARRPFLRAETTFAATLRLGRWPGAVRAGIGELAAFADTLAKRIRVAGDAATTQRAAWISAVRADAAANARSAHEVRSTLGLPTVEHYRPAPASRPDG